MLPATKHTSLTETCLECQRPAKRGRASGKLAKEDAGAAHFLGAQRVEERRDQRVHHLEVGRQRRRVLLRRVEALFAERLRVDRRAGAAVDEHEFRAQHIAFALHVDALHHRHAASELVIDFALLRDDPALLLRREEDGAGDDQRLLEFLAELLPVGGVGKDALVGRQVLLVLDARGELHIIARAARGTRLRRWLRALRRRLRRAVAATLVTAVGATLVAAIAAIRAGGFAVSAATVAAARGGFLRAAGAGAVRQRGADRNGPAGRRDDVARGVTRNRRARRAMLGQRFARLILRDLRQREHVRFDHAQVGPSPKLAAQQAYRLEIRIHIVRAAGDEPDHVDALERRHVELRLDRRFDRNLVEVGTRGRGQRQYPTNEYCCGSS